MLEATRFARLLRQAHDAEVADVRKVGEDEFEVIGRGIEPAPTAVRSTAPVAEAPESNGAPPVAAPSDAASRGGIRFRRGARLPAAPPAIPMVGVVSLDEEPQPERPARGRKKAARPSEAEAAPKEAAPKKKASKPRARKKAEA